MELLSLQQSPPATFSPAYSRKLPSLGRRLSFFSPRATSSPTKLLFSSSDIEKCPDARDSRFFDIGQPHAGNVRVAAGSNALATESISEETCSGDELAFVAGATGRVGSRTVRELLKLGFRVRAGVRSKQRAESLVQSVQQMKIDGDPNSSVQLVERLELVQCNLENRGDIRTAIGSASIVICCIGASEKELLDISGPLRIDYIATKNLIDEATALKVYHFILLTSLGTNKIGFPAAILNLFWGVLFWKRKAEEALLASGLPYTIVRPGGMERPTDAYKETHNLVLANEDTYFGGQVSNLQVAELIAFMAKNRSLSFCKVVEVIAETTAPRTQMKDLLLTIPSQRVDTSPPKEPQPMPKPDPASSQPTSTRVETTGKPQQTRLLSPYAAYADLKPPTSPTPTQSTTSSGKPGTDATESNAVHSQRFSVTRDSTLEKESVSKKQPLSPYTTYDDLKPPTSPTPTAIGTTSSPTKPEILVETEPEEKISEQVPEHKQTIENISPYTGISTVEKPSSDSSASNFRITPAATLRPLSPYAMYDDLKPPASPSPTLPQY